MDVATEGTVLAGLIGISMGMVRIVEHLLTYAFTKMKKQESIGLVVHLDPQTSQLLLDTREHVGQISEIVRLTDGDGVKLVYTPRRSLDEIHEMAAALNGVSKNAERCAEATDDISKKTESIDRRTESIEKLLAKKSD